jgi:hypothetical protein
MKGGRELRGLPAADRVADSLPLESGGGATRQPISSPQIRRLRRVIGGLIVAGSICASRAEPAASAFDQANKLYEQGKYAEAAAGYEAMIHSGATSPTLYFNLGNACFKAGQKGRAIAAYRQAETLAPRDPSLRFNLQFVRNSVSGRDTVPGTRWQRWLATLTLNEWTALAAGAFWLWFLLLALREFRPAWRKTLSGYTTAAGLAAVLLAACLGAAAFEQANTRSAVVIVPEAIVRYGPLEESQVFYQLRDGMEVSVLDEKQISGNEAWLQVQDNAHRVGWLKRDQVISQSTTWTR